MKPEPRIPRYMAYPPRPRTPRPDSAMRDATWIAWGVAFLLFCYWLAPHLTAVKP